MTAKRAHRWLWLASRIWGGSIHSWALLFEDAYFPSDLRMIERRIDSGHIVRKEGRLRLTDKGAKELSRLRAECFGETRRANNRGDIEAQRQPVEHYTAENEPHISEYAVRPPYLQTIVQRALAHTTLILFGDRGAGKSATRITLFNEIWGSTRADKRPLAVNLIDFTNVTSSLRKGELTENELVREVAYLVIEQVLSWLSSLTEDDRAPYTDGMTSDEEDLTVALLKAFYLPRPDMDRERSANDALRLLNGAWKTKSAVWVSQRWSALSGIIAAVVDILAKKAGAEPGPQSKPC